MSTTYKPRAGSVAEFVIAHGGPLTANLIAEQFDINARGVQASLSTAVQHGALIVEQRAGINWWRVPGVITTAEEEKRFAAEAADDVPRPTPRPPPRKYAAPPKPEATPPKVQPNTAIPAANGRAKPPRKPRRTPVVAQPTTRRELARAARAGRSFVFKPPAAAEPVGRVAMPKLVCGIFNDGSLLCEPRGREPVRFDPEEMRDLLTFLLKLDQLARPLAERNE